MKGLREQGVLCTCFGHGVLVLELSNNPTIYEFCIAAMGSWDICKNFRFFFRFLMVRLKINGIFELGDLGLGYN